MSPGIRLPVHGGISISLPSQPLQPLGRAPSLLKATQNPLKSAFFFLNSNEHLWAPGPHEAFLSAPRALPKGCQMLLFSATFKETVRAFAMQIVSNPIVIKLREEELALSNIRQYFFVCRSREEKYRALCNIYGSITIGQAIIFCQVRVARRVRGQRGQKWFVLQHGRGAPKSRSGDVPCVSLPLAPREASRPSASALPFLRC